eukprot:GGOE01001231.1.p1 GENE.GGOE01001231.1~~GGOE01001231.1.p1  ORF type:complete len:181 (-),score=55.78 GGOE01001231.1:287-763(-)
MARYQKHKFGMKSTRAYDRLSADEPIFTERVRKRQKREAVAEALLGLDLEDLCRKFFRHLDAGDVDEVLAMVDAEVAWTTPTQNVKGQASVRKLLEKPKKPDMEASWSKSLGLVRQGEYSRSGTVCIRPTADPFAAEQIVHVDDGKVKRFVEQRKNGY